MLRKIDDSIDWLNQRIEPASNGVHSYRCVGSRDYWINSAAKLVVWLHRNGIQWDGNRHVLTLPVHRAMHSGDTLQVGNLTTNSMATLHAIMAVHLGKLPTKPEQPAVPPAETATEHMRRAAQAWEIQTGERVTACDFEWRGNATMESERDEHTAYGASVRVQA